MKRFGKFTAILLAVCVVFASTPVCLASNASAQEIIDRDYQDYLQTEGSEQSALEAGVDYVRDEILFNVLREYNNTASLNAISKDFNLEILETIDQSALQHSTSLGSLQADTQTLYLARFNAENTSAFELCKALNSLDYIQDAEPNYLYASESFDMPTEITSSSLYRSEQKWYFDNMNLTGAWERYSNLGEGTVVCVIDNGLNFTHNEIENRLWDDGNGNHGYNAEFNNHDIYGKLSGGPEHGSHCAGIIAMESNNGGLVGVAPKAKIMACNAVSTSSGMFTNANLIKSLEYAVENGADVISMSLGGYSFSFNMEKALARASFSAVILCAAGNEGLSAATRLHYPSASAAVIGVMALGSGSSTNTLSSYSNYDLTGRYYQVAAPGTDIYSIAAQSDTGYVSMDGTSMATPFMAGIAALYVSEHPELSPAEARNAIINAAGELVAGYNTATLSLPFKKATPYTLLGETCAPAQSVSIADRYVDAAVRDALHVGSSYKLTNYDLECVSYLDLSATLFKNYAALEALPRLTSLNLSGTNMTDADAQALAAYLPNTLLNFDLSGNHLTNLDFFANYEGFISRLNVSGNQIIDISGIANRTMLSDLDISANRVHDISTLSTLTNIIYFYAPGNLIENVTPIIGLNKLEEVYFGNYNPNFTDMFGETYFLSGALGNHIYSLEAFMNLRTSSRLHYINLSYNYVQRDEQFNYRASKLMQTLDTIAKTHKFENVFAEDIAYKLVLSPAGTDDLIFADDISFANGRNFTTLYLDGSGSKIPYSIEPANANAQNGVSLSVKNPQIAYLGSDGMLYARNAGSTYVTLTLESGRVRTFFVNVEDAFICSAAIYNPSSSYTAGEQYTAIVYTNPCEELLMRTQSGNTVGEYTSTAKYCYNLTDRHGNPFQKWLIPFTIDEAGSYTLEVLGKAKGSASFSQSIGSFDIVLDEPFGNTVYGTLASIYSRFDTRISLFADDGTLLQTQIVCAGFRSFKFTNVANGRYSISFSREGYKDYVIENILVEGDTLVDDNIDGGINFASCAGDFNGDNNIDIADISILLLSDNYALATSVADNILCDINNDNSIDITDLAIMIPNTAK